MSNEYVFYNQEIKERFLNEYPERTRKSYQRIFQKSQPLEKEWGKDLFDFDIDEIGELMSHLNPLSNNAAKYNMSIISRYITKCIEYGYRDSNINILDSASPDWHKQFVDDTIKRYFSEEELSEIEDDCENAQDAVIFRLLFEGVGGISVSEIRNLKKSDVNFDTGELLLTNETGEQRTLIVSEKCLRLIRQANNQEIYYKRNGNVDPNARTKHTFLIDNDYVVRMSKTRAENLLEPVDKSIVYRRVDIIKEELGIPYFTTKSIQRSGMIYEAKKILEKEEKLEKEQIQKIADKFNQTNYYPLLEFCNEEMIEKLYGE